MGPSDEFERWFDVACIAVTKTSIAHQPDQHAMTKWWRLVKQAGQAWVDDYAPSMGAALSYYSVFSMAPLLLIVISIAGLVFGEEAVRGEVFVQLQSVLGSDTAKAIEGLLASVRKPEQGVLAHPRRTGDPADRRDDGVCRTAGRAGPHLARAGAR
jgi:Virulence factor BrkB